jgi:hypothetical protein
MASANRGPRPWSDTSIASRERAPLQGKTSLAEMAPAISEAFKPCAGVSEVFRNLAQFFPSCLLIPSQMPSPRVVRWESMWHPKFAQPLLPIPLG